jgi:hypothetical protein
MTDFKNKAEDHNKHIEPAVNQKDKAFKDAEAKLRTPVHKETKA